MGGGSCGVFVCIDEGWGGDSLDTIGYHGGGPSLIHIPLMPVGNLWDRHALSQTHPDAHPPPPRWSPLPLLRTGKQWQGWGSAQMHSEVFTLVSSPPWTGHTPALKEMAAEPRLYHGKPSLLLII